MTVRGSSMFSGYVGSPGRVAAQDWFDTSDLGFSMAASST